MTTPEDILRDHPPATQALARELQALILRLVPEMTVKAYPGWHGIGFRHPRAGYVCGLFPREEQVRFLFEKGIQLQDPAGLLSGDGTQSRYIDFSPGDTVPESDIEFLLLEALQL